MLELSSIIKTQLAIRGGSADKNQLCYYIDYDEENVEQELEQLVKDGEISRVDDKIYTINNFDDSSADNQSKNTYSDNVNDYNQNTVLKSSKLRGLKSNENTIIRTYNKSDEEKSRSIIDERVNNAEKWKQIHSHRNIINILRIETDDNPLIQMERADSSLKNMNLPLNTTPALKICLSIVEAIDHAHENNICHLNIKPSNVLLFHQGEISPPRVKVSDFDCSSLLRNDKKNLPLKFAAPEQNRPQKYGSVGEKTDIYQIGNILHIMIAGRPLYLPKPGLGVTYLPDPPVSGDFPTALKPAVASSPSDRFDSVTEIKDVLKNII